MRCHAGPLNVEARGTTRRKHCSQTCRGHYTPPIRSATNFGFQRTPRWRHGSESQYFRLATVHRDGVPCKKYRIIVSRSLFPPFVLLLQEVANPLRVQAISPLILLHSIKTNPFNLKHTSLLLSIIPPHLQASTLLSLVKNRQTLHLHCVKGNVHCVTWKRISLQCTP